MVVVNELSVCMRCGRGGFETAKMQCVVATESAHGGVGKKHNVGTIWTCPPPRLIQRPLAVIFCYDRRFEVDTSVLYDVIYLMVHISRYV